MSAPIPDYQGETIQTPPQTVAGVTAAAGARSEPIRTEVLPIGRGGSRLPDPSELPCSFGRYQLLACLGGGGMGRVYLAEDTFLQRQVALKMPQASDSDHVQQRFLEEARAAARISHPNICPIYDIGEIDGVPYLAMEYIHGPSLARYLTQHGPLAPIEAAQLVVKLARTMQVAHARGVIHRDLKPANIMLRQTDVGGPGGLASGAAPPGRPSLAEPLITDFGLARRLDRESQLTQTGVPIGTPAYLSPEQAAGRVNEMGPPTDIFSLGMILYELLAGRPPFRGDPLTVIIQIATHDAPPLSQFRPGIDARLEGILRQAIARELKYRFASMSQFADALEQWLAVAELPKAAPGDLSEVSLRLDDDEPLGPAEVPVPPPAATPSASPRRAGKSEVVAAVEEEPAAPRRAQRARRRGEESKPAPAEPPPRSGRGRREPAEPAPVEATPRRRRRKSGPSALLIAALALGGGMLLVGALVGPGLVRSVKESVKLDPQSVAERDAKSAVSGFGTRRVAAVEVAGLTSAGATQAEAARRYLEQALAYAADLEHDAAVVQFLTDQLADGAALPEFASPAARRQHYEGLVRRLNEAQARFEASQRKMSPYEDSQASQRFEMIPPVQVRVAWIEGDAGKYFVTPVMSYADFARRLEIASGGRVAVAGLDERTATIRLKVQLTASIPAAFVPAPAPQPEPAKPAPTGDPASPESEPDPEPPAAAEAAEGTEAEAGATKDSRPSSEGN